MQYFSTSATKINDLCITVLLTNGVNLCVHQSGLNEELGSS